MTRDINIIQVALIIAPLLASCVLVASKTEADAFEGVYVRYGEHEFGREFDTLVIRRSATETDRFTISRRWKYERILNGHSLHPEYKTKSTAAIYDVKRRVLMEINSGRSFQLDSKKEKLTSGSLTYVKQQ